MRIIKTSSKAMTRALNLEEVSWQIFLRFLTFKKRIFKNKNFITLIEAFEGAFNKNFQRAFNEIFRAFNNTFDINFIKACK